MASAVIMVTSYDPAFLSIFEHLVRVEAEAGNSPIAFDVTPILSTPVDSYHRATLRRFGIAYPGHDIAARMRALGARYVLTDAEIVPAEVAPLDDRLEAELKIAIQSALITFFRADSPDRKHAAVRKAEHGFLREGRAIYRRVRALCAAEPDVSVAYIANGRFPNQKLGILAFQDAGVITRHLEKGEASGRAYVQEYAPQDRIRSQESIAAILAGLTPEEINAVAEEWMARRAPAAGSSNRYASLWNDDLPASIAERKASGALVAGFYTSSQDEFQSLGPDWLVHEWQDQFDAFDRVMTWLESEGYACYLRVHPNLATRSHGLFKKERDGIRSLARKHPKLTVIWHDDQANTYALLGASDAVIVWNSTTGLEASARGIPVWATAASRYDRTADVREVLSQAELDRDGIHPWTVDPDKAKQFIAYLVLRDQDISPAPPWTSWDVSNPPLGVRLAAIAVSGGIPRPSAAVISLADVYRHRSLTANVRALRRR